MTCLLPGGFAAAGVASGIKPDGRLDLALVAVTNGPPATAAAVFTENLSVAAPVVLSRAHLLASDAQVRAVILNSGCANAATGDEGVRAAALMADTTARHLRAEPEQVLVCSTGPIGHQLPPRPLESGIPAACAALESSEEALARAARAIMTTDRREKLASASLASGPQVTGIAKGAGMIAPNMASATMLAVLMTDAVVSAPDLQAALDHAVDHTFNRLTIDGCMSTNDTVILLASGVSGIAAGAVELVEGVTVVCADLAHQMAADAEGGTKVVHVRVTGAADDASALKGARAVAESLLVKCSWYGEDPNWGRVVSALGAAGVLFDQSAVLVAYGPEVVCRDGMPVDFDHEVVASYLALPEFELNCDLGLGGGAAEILSADLTHAYVDENMGHS